MNKIRVKKKVKTHFHNNPNSKHYKMSYNNVGYVATRNGKQIKIQKGPSGSYQSGGASSDVVDNLKKMLALISEAEEYAMKFYNKNNKSAVAKARKALGEVQKLSKMLRQMIQSDKNKMTKTKKGGTRVQSKTKLRKKTSYSDTSDKSEVSSDSDKVSTFGVEDTSDSIDVVNDGDYGYY